MAHFSPASRTQISSQGTSRDRQRGHLHDTPWIGGYRTSVAGIGPDEKIQLDGQKWDQFRFTGQPDLADLCDVHGRRSSTARSAWSAAWSISRTA
jgi:hypothetical protein